MHWFLVAVCCALVLLFLVTGWPFEPQQHWIAIHTGTLNQSDEYYGFWSGFGSILERLLELVVLGSILLFRHNCHSRGCYRIGRFPALEGGGWHYCKRHHSTDGEHR